MPPLPTWRATPEYLALLKKPPKHRCVLTHCRSLENWRLLTLTFSPEFRVYSAAKLFYITVGKIFKNLRSIAKREFSFVPELTSMGMLHYHILLRTSEHVRLSTFINYWESNYGMVDGKPDNVFCILGLKAHYFRKQNADMAKVLDWPLRQMVITGILQDHFCRTLEKRLRRRRADAAANKLSTFRLKYIDLTTI